MPEDLKTEIERQLSSAETPPPAAPGAPPAGGQAPAPAPEKNKGGHPTKEQQEANATAAHAKEIADNLTVQKIMAPLVRWPFNVMARRRGDHWRLKKDEIEALADALEPVALKYLPALFINWGAELLLLVTVALIVGPRMDQDKELEDKANKEAEARALARKAEHEKELEKLRAEAQAAKAEATAAAVARALAPASRPAPAPAKPGRKPKK